MTMLRQLSSGVFGTLRLLAGFTNGLNFSLGQRRRMREPFTVYFARDVLIDNRFPRRSLLVPIQYLGLVQ